MPDCPHPTDSAESLRAAISPNSFSQLKRHNLYSAHARAHTHTHTHQKKKKKNEQTRGVTAIFASQTKAQQRGESLMHSERKQNREQQSTFGDDVRYDQFRPNETRDTRVIAGLESACIPPRQRGTTWRSAGKLVRKSAVIYLVVV